VSSFIPSERGAAPVSQSRAILRDLLVVAAVGAGIWMAHRLGRIVVVLILAMFFAYVIAPLVELAQSPVSLRGRSRRLPRGAAIAVVYLLLAGGLSAGVALLWPRAAQQLDEAIASAPMYTESFRAWEHGWTRYYERLRIPIELRHTIDTSLLGAGDATIMYARGSLLALIAAVSGIPWLILVPVLAFLLLKDATSIRRTILTALPHRIQLRGHRLFEELNATLMAYVRAQLIACVVVGSLCGIGFAVLGNPYAILLGVLAAVMEFIPLIGPFVVAAVAVGIAVLHDPMLAIWTAVFLAVLRIVEDYVIYPRLIGRDIHLHPLVVIVAVLAGVELGGIAGIFISIPVVALVTVVGRHWLEWRGRDAESLSKDPGIEIMMTGTRGERRPAPESSGEHQAAVRPFFATDSECERQRPAESSQ
jgi:predicted PurR-regulated permease PerM